MHQCQDVGIERRYELTENISSLSIRIFPSNLTRVKRAAEPPPTSLPSLLWVKNLPIATTLRASSSALYSPVMSCCRFGQRFHASARCSLITEKLSTVAQVFQRSDTDQRRLEAYIDDPVSLLYPRPNKQHPL